MLDQNTIKIIDSLVLYCIFLFPYKIHKGMQHIFVYKNGKYINMSSNKYIEIYEHMHNYMDVTFHADHMGYTII